MHEDLLKFELSISFRMKDHLSELEFGWFDSQKVDCSSGRSVTFSVGETFLQSWLIAGFPKLTNRTFLPLKMLHPDEQKQPFRIYLQ